MVDTLGLNPSATRRAGSSPAEATVGWAGARPILIRWACQVQLLDLQLVSKFAVCQRLGKTGPEVSLGGPGKAVGLLSLPFGVWEFKG